MPHDETVARAFDQTAAADRASFQINRAGYVDIIRSLRGGQRRF
jgi:hypothetical protein